MTSPSVHPLGLPEGDPAELGFSSDRLAYIGAAFKAGVANEEIPGAVVAIARRGRIAFFETYGYIDRAKALPMPKDAIFRIASMSKPVASVALMMLAEEGRVRLTDPVERYVPELGANLKVAKADGSSEPARGLMTIQDILRHTSGLTRALDPSTPTRKAYVEAGLRNRTRTLAEHMTLVSTLPLANHPGTRWEYSLATDVVGRVVEVVSGESFDHFVATRITGPLGMADAGFHVPEAKWSRIAEHDVSKLTPASIVPPDPRQPPKMASGNAGMVASTRDYIRFSQMMLNGGSLDGVRILGRKTVELMTHDHLGPIKEATSAAEYLPGPGYGFGLGFAVRLDAGMSPAAGSVGDHYWGGAYGTYFWIDPKEQLVSVMMLQVPGLREYRQMLRDLVYQAIAD